MNRCTMNRIHGVLGVFTVLALSTMTIGCHQGEPASLAVPSVRLAPVREVQFDTGIRYSVSLLPCKQADLAFKSGGIVERIRQVRGPDGLPRPVTMGDTVPAGVELARVRTTEYRDRLNQARAQLAQARGQLESARASQRFGVEEFARAQSLYSSASMTKQDYDHAVQQRDAANAEVAEALAGVASAQAQIAAAGTALADTAIYAPFAGSIVERRIEVGDLAGSAAPAFLLADLSCVKADFTVPGDALAQARLGRVLYINLEQLRRQIPAIITAVSPVADPRSRVFTVELTARNPDRSLRPGMIGDLRLGPLSTTDHLVVPLSSLVQGQDGGFAVFVPRKDLSRQDGGLVRVYRAAVVIGASEGTDVQVLHGVSAGESVVTDGAQTLHDGDTVRVIE